MLGHFGSTSSPRAFSGIRARLCEALAVALLLTGCGNGVDADAWLRDDAGLLTDEQTTYLARYHRSLLDNYGIDYRVIVTEDRDDVNLQANRLFHDMDVGTRSETGRGLLLLLNTATDEVRLEVGQALEGDFPDAFIAYLEHRQMVPFFRENRIATGIVATTELIVTRAQNAAMQAGHEGELWAARSGGAGARTEARLGEGRDERFRRGDAVKPGDTPEETLAAYFAAMEARNARPDLAIYTAESQKMLAQWTVTPAQMDNIVRSYRDCAAEPAREHWRYPLAVIRYPVEQRRCSPFFFRREDGAWRLDLTVMQYLIRFGSGNSWRFERGVRNPYDFAFAGWCYDRRGYPIGRCKLRWYLSTQTYEDGTFVEWVGENSPAERLGLQVGDRLVSWNGIDVVDYRQMSRFMSETPAGALVEVVVERAGMPLTLTTEAPH